MKKLKKTERFMIENFGRTDEYAMYYCDKDGLFMKRRDTTDHKCPYCKKEFVELTMEQLKDMM